MMGFFTWLVSGSLSGLAAYAAETWFVFVWHFILSYESVPVLSQTKFTVTVRILVGELCPQRT